MNVVDNFLDRSSLESITNLLFSNGFPWYMSTGISREGSEGMYFTHTFYQNYVPKSDHIGILGSFINALEPKAIIRLRAALYPKTSELQWHGMHTDYPFEHKGCILYLNTCDGYTGFSDDKVESIENRALFFDPSKPHCSTSCTNQDFRAIIIMNHF